MVRFINQKTAIKSLFDRTLYILYKFYTFTPPPKLFFGLFKFIMSWHIQIHMYCTLHVNAFLHFLRLIQFCKDSTTYQLKYN